jgi:Kef-type K+ transport system membrane component KefB
MDLAGGLKVLGERLSEGPALAFLVLMTVLIVGPRLAEALRLPAMVGLVLAGMAVGPHASRALDAREIALSNWGNFGLLYLMFTAGLELDLKLFARMKKAALTFALLSFAVPFTLGIGSARLLGYAWLGAVLMGSNWGSHTLVTYPILRQMGLARNRAVATVVGATAVTDTSALLVLTGVTVMAKKSSSMAAMGLEIAIGLAVLAAWTLFALPRLARLFFARVGGDGAYRFVFGTAAFLSGALVAQASGIDGIVGAFFSGIGLGRAIPERSPLMDRVQFFGGALFIPIFLVSVGILLDPKVLIDPKTLLFALVFTVAVLGGKALAAVIAGRVFRFTWAEVGVMSGLSGSQAAATLATTLVGAKLGIFDKQTINAVLVVILVSMVVTPLLVTFFGKRVPGEKGASEALGGTVMVPIWGDSTRPLLTMAGRLASPDGGMVMPVSIVTQESTEAELASQRTLLAKAGEWIAKDGLEGRTVFRVSTSVAVGLLHAVRGENATLLLAEWRNPQQGELLGNAEAFHLLERSPVPVLLGRGTVDHFERIVLAARRRDLIPPDRLDLDLALQVAQRLAGHGHAVTYVGALAGAATSPLGLAPRHDNVEASDPIEWLGQNLRETDLLLLPGLDAARAALARVPNFTDRRLLVAIASRGGAFQSAERTGDLIIGRSATESDQAPATPG